MPDLFSRVAASRRLNNLLELAGLKPLAVKSYTLVSKVLGVTSKVVVGGYRAEFLTETPAERRMYDTYLKQEHEVLEYLLSNFRKDDVFYDIGANTGGYTVFAAQALPSESQVHAFEPYYRNVSRLQENLAHNEAKATVHQIALGEETGLATLSIQSPITGTGTATTADRAGATDTVTVPISRGREYVNQFGLRPPTVIKVDVEGAEAGVISGLEGIKTIRTIIIETHGDDRSHLVGLLNSRGFAVTELETEHRNVHLIAEK